MKRPAGLDTARSNVKRQEEKGFVLGKWRGKVQWRCTRCPWDTLKGERAMLDHIRTRHTPRVRRVATGLVGADGKPTFRTEVIENG